MALGAQGVNYSSTVGVHQYQDAVLMTSHCHAVVLVGEIRESYIEMVASDIKCCFKSNYYQLSKHELVFLAVIIYLWVQSPQSKYLQHWPLFHSSLANHK